jgi:outer membrane protein assembly factor BamB
VQTGKLRWSHGVDGRHETVLGGVGPRSTPTIFEGNVYALGATGKLRCLDGSNGELVWMKDLLAEFGVSQETDLANIAWGRAASPLIVDQRVIVPAGGPSDKPVSLVAYEPHTGEEIWRGGERQISFASPALATLAGVRQIVIVNEDTLSGHDVETGKTLWSHPWEGKSNMNASASQAVPLPGDRVFVSKGYGGGSLMLHVTRNDDQWDAAEVWRDKGLLKTKFANIAVKDGYAYGLSDGILECVELENGDRAWKGGRYGHGQILLVEDNVLVQAESGEVVLVEATPEKHVELGRFPAIEGKTWNNLCLYGPFLLCRNSEEAACYRLPVAK